MLPNMNTVTKNIPTDLPRVFRRALDSYLPCVMCDKRIRSGELTLSYNRGPTKAVHWDCFVNTLEDIDIEETFQLIMKLKED